MMAAFEKNDEKEHGRKARRRRKKRDEQRMAQGASRPKREVQSEYAVSYGALMADKQTYIITDKKF
jgi:hypothetical protein